MKQIGFHTMTSSDETCCLADCTIWLVIPLNGEVKWVSGEDVRFIGEHQIGLVVAVGDCLCACRKQGQYLVIDMPEDYACAYFHNTVQGRDGRLWEIGHLLQPIKLLIIHEFFEGNEEEATLLLSYLLHKLTDRIEGASLKYIHGHFTEKIDVRALAEMEHYTPSYYCEWFKRHMEMTPLEYIHFLRVQRAKELLKDSRLSVVVIAGRLGYDYHASFTRMFKKYARLSPSAYRARLNGEQKQVQLTE
ncbi:MAG: AraC family transcriptional regulator [Sporolactobacillus sp.]